MPKMAKPDWAIKKVAKEQWGNELDGFFLRPEHAAKLLRAERKRAVRVVEKVIPNNWLHPYLTGDKALLPGARGGPITPVHVQRLLQQIKGDILTKLNGA